MRSRSLVALALALALALVALAGCSTAPSSPVVTASPTPVRTSPPTPTPTPLPTPAPEDELIGACHGKPVAWAAPYAGKVHPLVIAGPWGAPRAWDRIDPDLGPNQRWSGGEWTNEMIQLVICPESADPKPSGSCGIYSLVEDVTGELIRLRDKVVIRVVVAQTGKRLQSQALYGPVPACPATQGVPLSATPPWHILGDSVTLDQIGEYATKVSKQPVK
jgi:hypothetical protein